MPSRQATLKKLTNQEAAILTKLQQLEAQLTDQIERRHDPNQAMMAMLTMKILYKRILAKHNELVRCKDEQIKNLKAMLMSYGAD